MTEKRPKKVKVYPKSSQPYKRRTEQEMINIFSQIHNCIEIEIYNNRRPHASLNYLTPFAAYEMTVGFIKQWKH